MKFLLTSSCDLVPKNQVGIMLLRGIAGLGLMAWSFTLLPVMPLPGFLVMGVAVLLLKGCPACWGMHMVNAVRGAALKQKEPAVSDPAIEMTEAALRERRAYKPRDMSAHLFPPEDVERFRRMRQAGEAAPASADQKNTPIR